MSNTNNNATKPKPKRNAKGQYMKGSSGNAGNTLYKPSMCEKAIAFVKSQLEKGEYTTIMDVAQHFGIRKSTLYNWRGTYPEWDEAIQECLNLMENDIEKGFVRGTYHPMGCKWVLDVNYSKRETTQQDIKQEVKGKLEVITLSADIEEEAQ